MRLNTESGTDEMPIWLACPGPGWSRVKGMAESDSADGFPHSYLITHPTHTPYDGSVPHFPGMPDNLRDRMTTCWAMDYILRMGASPVKHW